MYLNVAREQIYPCVTALSVIAERSGSTIEALRGIRLYADVSAQSLTLTAFDLTTALQYTIDAEVEDAGCVVVDATLLRDILRLAKNDLLKLETDLYTNQIKLDIGAQYHLSFLSGEKFPMPEFIVPDESVTITGVPDLAARLVHLAVSKGKDDNLSGIKLSFSDQGLKAACTDGGSRVAQVTQPGENRASLDLLIPAKALGLLATLVGDEDVLYVGATKNCAVFYDGVMIYSVRLLPGDYLDIDALLDYVKPEYAVTVGKAELCQALSLAAAVPESRCLKVKIDQDCLEVGGTSAAGGCTSIVPIKQGSGPAPEPFYYGENLLRSLTPLTDPLLLAFSGQGHLLACDTTTRLFQNPMRPPSQIEAEQKKKKTAPKKAAEKRTKKSVRTAAKPATEHKVQEER